MYNLVFDPPHHARAVYSIYLDLTFGKKERLHNKHSDVRCLCHPGLTSTASVSLVNAARDFIESEDDEGGARSIVSRLAVEFATPRPAMLAKVLEHSALVRRDWLVPDTHSVMFDAWNMLRERAAEGPDPAWDGDLISACTGMQDYGETTPTCIMRSAGRVRGAGTAADRSRSPSPSRPSTASTRTAASRRTSTREARLRPRSSSCVGSRCSSRAPRPPLSASTSDVRPPSSSSQRRANDVPRQLRRCRPLPHRTARQQLLKPRL